MGFANWWLTAQIANARRRTEMTTFGESRELFAVAVSPDHTHGPRAEKDEIGSTRRRWVNFTKCFAGFPPMALRLAAADSRIVDRLYVGGAANINITEGVYIQTNPRIGASSHQYPRGLRNPGHTPMRTVRAR
jgi:hypothetical protein